MGCGGGKVPGSASFAAGYQGSPSSEQLGWPRAVQLGNSSDGHMRGNEQGIAMSDVMEQHGHVHIPAVAMTLCLGQEETPFSSLSWLVSSLIPASCAYSVTLRYCSREGTAQLSQLRSNVLQEIRLRSKLLKFA